MSGTSIIAKKFTSNDQSIGHEFLLFYLGLDERKLVLWGFTNNKGTDQPAHLDSIVSRLATCEISIFYLVSVAEQIG